MRLFTKLFFMMMAMSLLLGVSPMVHAEGSSDPWKMNFGNKPRPKNARTIIDAEEGGSFDDVANSVEFLGKVVVKDPQFTLFCDKLHVVMNKNRQGVQRVLATGNVIIELESINDQGTSVKTTAQAGEVLYEPGTGDITLKKWPQIQQGRSYQVATEEGTLMILNNKGTFRTIGQSRTKVADPSGMVEKTNKE